MGGNSSKPRDYTEGLPEANRHRLKSFRKNRMRVTPKSVGACSSCVKFMIGFMSKLVYAFNLFFFVLGVLLLAAGIYAQLKLNQLGELLHVPLSVALIVLASVVICLTFFGCVGAYCKRRGLLKVYWGLLLIVILFQIAAGAIFYAERGELINAMGTSWHDPENDATKVYLQDHFQCCGWINVTDSPAVSSYCPASTVPPPPPPEDPPAVPENDSTTQSASSFSSQNEYETELPLDDNQEPFMRDPPASNDPSDNSDAPDQATVGCRTAIVDYFNSQLLVLGIVAVSVSSLELIALFFSFCLIFMIRPDSADDDMDHDSVALLEDI